MSIFLHTQSNNIYLPNYLTLDHSDLFTITSFFPNTYATVTQNRIHTTKSTFGSKLTSNRCQLERPIRRHFHKNTTTPTARRGFLFVVVVVFLYFGHGSGFVSYGYSLCGVPEAPHHYYSTSETVLAATRPNV